MSSRSFAFEIRRTSSASPGRLFRLATDGARWSEWAKPLIQRSGWQRSVDPPGAVGAIRRFGGWPVLTFEETLEYEQDRRHVYALVRPTPVRDYRGEVLFTPMGIGGTELTWRGSFTEKIPHTGPIASAFLKLIVRFISARMVRAAEAQP